MTQRLIQRNTNNNYQNQNHSRSLGNIRIPNNSGTYSSSSTVSVVSNNEISSTEKKSKNSNFFRRRKSDSDSMSHHLPSGADRLNFNHINEINIENGNNVKRHFWSRNQHKKDENFNIKKPILNENNNEEKDYLFEDMSSTVNHNRILNLLNIDDDDDTVIENYNQMKNKNQCQKNHTDNDNYNFSNNENNSFLNNENGKLTTEEIQSESSVIKRKKSFSMLTNLFRRRNIPTERNALPKEKEEGHYLPEIIKSQTIFHENDENDDLIIKNENATLLERIKVEINNNNNDSINNNNYSNNDINNNNKKDNNNHNHNDDKNNNNNDNGDDYNYNKNSKNEIFLEQKQTKKLFGSKSTMSYIYKKMGILLFTSPFFTITALFSFIFFALFQPIFVLFYFFLIIVYHYLLR